MSLLLQLVPLGNEHFGARVMRTPTFAEPEGRLETQRNGPGRRLSSGVGYLLARVTLDAAGARGFLISRFF